MELAKIVLCCPELFIEVGNQIDWFSVETYEARERTLSFVQQCEKFLAAYAQLALDRFLRLNFDDSDFFDKETRRHFLEILHKALRNNAYVEIRQLDTDVLMGYFIYNPREFIDVEDTE